jgi:hypothetical protein
MHNSRRCYLFPAGCASQEGLCCRSCNADGEGRTRKLPGVEAGERNRLAGGNPPADMPAEVAVDSTHPAHHSIDRYPRREEVLIRMEP